jgi:hypothetical protein
VEPASGVIAGRTPVVCYLPELDLKDYSLEDVHVTMLSKDIALFTYKVTQRGVFRRASIALHTLVCQLRMGASRWQMGECVYTNDGSQVVGRLLAQLTTGVKLCAKTRLRAQQRRAHPQQPHHTRARRSR